MPSVSRSVHRLRRLHARNFTVVHRRVGEGGGGLNARPPFPFPDASFLLWGSVRAGLFRRIPTASRRQSFRRRQRVAVPDNRAWYAGLSNRHFFPRVTVWPLLLHSTPTAPRCF